MKEITQFENHTVEIWRRPRQRYINLRVRHDGALRVTCGPRVPKRDIYSFIRESEGFIKKSLAELADFYRKHPPKQALSGEEYLYFGMRKKLQVVWTWSSKIKVQFRDGEFEVLAPMNSSAEERHEALRKYFKKEGANYLRRCAGFWAGRMRAHPTSVSIRGQTSRWGSCTSRGDINLNWKLLAAPPEIIDYVVIHELAHLTHMDHSPRFWGLVAEYFPSYRQAKKWLREHEAELGVQFQVAPK
ncbi:MAG: M48 family metallopeptidase [Pseudobdellovibrionaceae bacterium]